MAQNKVVQACEKHWEAHKSDCSGFAKAVAQELGISLTGSANDIVDQTQRPPWTVLKSGVEAKYKADEGMLVVGGLKAVGNGHVVIVVPGPLLHNKYPTAYWGRLGSTGRKNATVNWSWDEDDRDDVTYSCIQVR